MAAKDADMTQTQACTHVLTHIATGMRDFCEQHAMPTDQAIHLVEQVLRHPTVRTWAAMQVMRLAPNA